MLGTEQTQWIGLWFEAVLYQRRIHAETDCPLSEDIIGNMKQRVGI